MNIEKDKQTEELLKYIYQASENMTEWSQCIGDKLLQVMDSQQLIDINQLKFQNSDQQTTIELPSQKFSFFSQIPIAHVDQQTEDKILNFKLNFVSAKRRDQLFKRHKKQQQDKITSRKKQVEKIYTHKSDNTRNIKGEFTLKRGQQSHTCSITGDDLDKLRPQTDLNDTIIANYLKYLQTQVFPEELDKEIFIYSSFFIQKLIGDMLRDEPHYNDRNGDFYLQKMRLKVTENYKNIKRWTRKVDIFEKQFLIIPINAYKHWYCIILVNPGCIIEPKPGKKAYIANCDSMFEKKPLIIDAIRMYLQVELQDKKANKIQITEANFPSYQLILPRQTNTHDCGLYMLTYIEHLLLNKKELENLQIVANREKLKIFPRNLIYTMRQRLKQLFIHLIQTSDQNARKQILKKYKEETELIIQQANQQIDYDRINDKEFKKYEAMNLSLIQSNANSEAELTQEQLEFACRVRFYYDPEINYYERDKPCFF